MPPAGESDPDPRAAPELPPKAEVEPVLAALQDLADAADDITAIARLIREHAPRMEEDRARLLTYREIIAAAPRPLIGAVLTDAIARFEAAGTRYRQAHGRVLQSEGMTLQEIAALWGLTRQRVSELLQSADGRGRRRGRPPGPRPAAPGPVG